MKNLSIIVSIFLALLNLSGCAGPGEDAQKAAEEFVTDIYAVSPEEVDNYKHLLNILFSRPKCFLFYRKITEKARTHIDI